MSWQIFYAIRLLRQWESVASLSPVHCMECPFVLNGCIGITFGLVGSLTLESGCECPLLFHILVGLTYIHVSARAAYRLWRARYIDKGSVTSSWN